MSGRRYAVAAVRIVAAGVLALAAVILAFFYEFLIEISAGLCGEHSRWWIQVVAVTVPLIVVGSWGLLHGWWILAAWPAAVFAAASCFALANYVQSGAHGHCETMTAVRVLGDAACAVFEDVDFDCVPAAGELDAVGRVVVHAPARELGACSAR